MTLMYTFLRLNIPEDAKLKKKHTLRKKQFLNLGLGFMSHSLLKNIKKKKQVSLPVAQTASGVIPKDPIVPSQKNGPSKPT